MKKTGIVLIVVGVIMMGITSFNYVTTKKVIDIGNLQVSKDENHYVQWSPIAGGLLLVGGIVLLVTAKKKLIT
jgi:uncharacterized membrane protein YidH (DUF202 family)